MLTDQIAVLNAAYASANFRFTLSGVTKRTNKAWCAPFVSSKPLYSATPVWQQMLHSQCLPQAVWNIVCRVWRALTVSDKGCQDGLLPRANLISSHTLSTDRYPLDIFSANKGNMQKATRTKRAADLNIWVTMLNNGGIIG